MEATIAMGTLFWNKKREILTEITALVFCACRNYFNSRRE
jgi:hypothetical protein